MLAKNYHLNQEKDYTYRDLQIILKGHRDAGEKINCRLNECYETLYAEVERLGCVIDNEPAIQEVEETAIQEVKETVSQETSNQMVQELPATEGKAVAKNAKEKMVNKFAKRQNVFGKWANNLPAESKKTFTNAKQFASNTFAFACGFLDGLRSPCLIV